jgi:hypothetical protein
MDAGLLWIAYCNQRTGLKPLLCHLIDNYQGLDHAFNSVQEPARLVFLFSITMGIILLLALLIIILFACFGSKPKRD